MGDHQLMHAAPAMYNGGGVAVSHGMWWNSNNNATAAAPPAACSTELAGFNTCWPSALSSAASYDVVADGGGKQAKSCTTTASSESPGGNNSSVTFQETASINDPSAGGGAAVAGYTDWNNNPYMGSGAGNMQGFLQVGGHHDMSSTTDHMNASSLMNNPSPNNNLDLALQGHHHQQQLISSLGHELLLSPTSPYGFQSSSLLRSLLEPTAKTAPAAGIQQYQYQQMGQIREPLQFTNDAAFWNASSAGFGMAMAAAQPTEQATMRGSVKPLPAPRERANLALKNVLEGVGDSGSITTKKATGGEPAFKKPRMETPSSLPTFKVRKEKLGDRITALQQLVSPFGKTDTASVLHETIEYIKFLHDQVGGLSAPYLKSGHHQHQVQHYLKSSSASPDKSSKDGEVSLKGRGLCLVPISSTFAVASEVPVDFWTPFGAQFR